MQTHKELSKQRSGKTASNIGGKAMPSQSPTVVQAQLETTAPGDVYEQEADRMADMVMRKMDGANTSEATPSNHCPTPTISCFGGTSMPLSSQMESQLQSMQGGGHAMPEGLRAQMEGSFGHDFSNVRLHTDSAAADMSRSINAKAFTHGNDIYFNQGQFQPNTAAGQHLIAHELTHTVQQGGKVAREEGEGEDIKVIRFTDEKTNRKIVAKKVDDEKEIQITKRYSLLLGDSSVKFVEPTEEMKKHITQKGANVNDNYLFMEDFGSENNLEEAFHTAKKKLIETLKTLYRVNFGDGNTTDKELEKKAIDYYTDITLENLEEKDYKLLGWDYNTQEVQNLTDVIGKLRAIGGDYRDNIRLDNLFFNKKGQISLLDYGYETEKFDENGVIQNSDSDVWDKLKIFYNQYTYILDSNYERKRPFDNKDILEKFNEKKKFWECRRLIFLDAYKYIKPLQLEFKEFEDEYPQLNISDSIPDLVSEIQKLMIDINNFYSEIKILFAAIDLFKKARGGYPIPIKAYWILRGLTKLAECKVMRLPAKVKIVIEVFNKSSELGDKIAPTYYKYTNAEERIKTVGDFYGGAETATGQIAAGVASVPGIGDLGYGIGVLAAKAYLALFE